jgi:hypothetical protein
LFAKKPAQAGFFVGSDFVGSDFVGSDFVASDFVASDFVGADFVGADFVGADFWGTRFLWEPIHRRSRGSGPVCGKHPIAAEAAPTREEQ